MKKFNFLIFFILIPFSFLNTVSANEKQNKLKFISEVKENWPYLAFASVPNIKNVEFIVSFSVDEEKSYITDIKCIDIFHYEILKTFDNKTKLENKSLKELLCFSIKRALNKIDNKEYFNLFLPKRLNALAFNFQNGNVYFTKLPHPPINPDLLLEDLFVYNLNIDDFGEIKIPDKYKSEIKESKI